MFRFKLKKYFISILCIHLRGEKQNLENPHSKFPPPFLFLCKAEKCLSKEVYQIRDRHVHWWHEISLKLWQPPLSRYKLFVNDTTSLLLCCFGMIFLVRVGEVGCDDISYETSLTPQSWTECDHTLQRIPNIPDKIQPVRFPWQPEVAECWHPSF